jgi:hypothetical protein
MWLSSTATTGACSPPESACKWGPTVIAALYPSRYFHSAVAVLGPLRRRFASALTRSGNRAMLRDPELQLYVAGEWLANGQRLWPRRRHRRGRLRRIVAGGHERGCRCAVRVRHPPHRHARDAVLGCGRRSGRPAEPARAGHTPRLTGPAASVQSKSRLRRAPALPPPGREPSLPGG